jgi:hypothetical protein
MRVTYPVAIDNDRAIWRAFANNYWPALYFVDSQSRVRHRHFGEGEYEQSERTIHRLLSDAGVAGIDGRLVTVEPRGVEASADWASLGSPENYLGYDRTTNFASPGGVLRDMPRSYAAPGRLETNEWSLSGDWTVGREAITLNEANGQIACRFHARDVHLVMAPAERGRALRFRVLIDGEAPGAAHGGDVDALGHGVVAEQRLYQLIRQPQPVVDRRIEIHFLDPGVEAYAFTFG